MRRSGGGEKPGGHRRRDGEWTDGGRETVYGRSFGDWQASVAAAPLASCAGSFSAAEEGGHKMAGS